MPGGMNLNIEQEYYILRNLKPRGQKIGYFNGTPLYDTVEDEWGRVYRYAGITSRVGRRYTAVLADREFIQPPGILYRMLKKARRI